MPRRVKYKSKTRRKPTRKPVRRRRTAGSKTVRRPRVSRPAKRRSTKRRSPRMSAGKPGIEIVKDSFLSRLAGTVGAAIPALLAGYLSKYTGKQLSEEFGSLLGEGMGRIGGIGRHIANLAKKFFTIGPNHNSYPPGINQSFSEFDNMPELEAVENQYGDPEVNPDYKGVRKVSKKGRVYYISPGK